jgi:glutamine synthetase
MKLQLEYVWLDGYEIVNFRSKTKIVDVDQDTYNDYNLKNVPVWSYDGSSTQQAEIDNSEIILKPVYYALSSSHAHALVLCATYKVEDGEHVPAKNNHYDSCAEVFKKYTDSHPWYGFEQEYYLLGENGLPLGSESFSGQGQYYCSVGSRNAYGRSFVDAHTSACINFGLQICGTNAEVGPGQWEYQIGPVEGIDAAHQLLLSRYLLFRTAEDFNYGISLHPKPWESLNELAINGSGCHTNFSTEKMRNDGGLAEIEIVMPALEQRHIQHVDNYGVYNGLRLTGTCETSSADNFSYGVGTRDTSVRIPILAKNEGKGYFEDRRPGSNVDPYLVGSLLLEAVHCT